MKRKLTEEESEIETYEENNREMRNKVPRKTTTVQNVLEAIESEKGGKQERRTKSRVRTGFFKPIRWPYGPGLGSGRSVRF